MVDSTDLPAQPGAEAPPEQPKLHTQDEVNAILAREKREYEAKMVDLKKKAAEWDKHQEATKTEIQRANEAKAAAEKELDALKLERDQEKWRGSAGRKWHIPEADWERLRGSTAEEIETDAKAWAKARGLDRTGGPTPPGGAPSGRSPFNQAILDAAGRGGR